MMESALTRYDAASRLLHWGMFALLGLQLVGGHVLEALPRGALRGFAFDAHESIGLLLLLLVVLRLAWRIAHPVRATPGPGWQHAAARLVHLLLYGLMIAMPLTGYAMVDAKGYDIAFFGLTAPDFLGKNEPLADTLKELHGVLGWMLAAAIGAHAGAALWHHFVVRDDVLHRMLGAGEPDARLR